MVGKTLSHYEINEKLGEGGMGVVYKARDSHLKRFVALKVLPPEMVADAERKHRFVQEARSASALNHPNIVTVHDIDQADGVDFIAMEYVEGKTLDELIGRKGLRLNEALKYGVQIADALAKAHAAGIVHRDLKPGNVMVTGDGRVKVLDFGLAMLTEAALASHGDATLTEVPKTETGVIVGTVSYMSPEQAEGKRVDARSDIFSFGSLLYEMLTGRRAFRRDSPALTLAAILHLEPPPLPAETPRDLEKVVTRCLRKDPARRFQHMGDVKVQLEELKEDSDSGRLAAAAQASRPALRWGRTVALTAVAVALAAAGWFWFLPPPPPSASSIEGLQITQLTSIGPEGAPAISPDGKFVAYAQNEGNDSSLWMLQIDTASPRQIAPPEPGTYIAGATVTPDGGFVEFLRSGLTVVQQELWRVPFNGGTPKKLLDSYVSAAGWSPDGQHIAFVRLLDQSTALLVADADGSHERQVTARKSPAQFRSNGSRPAWSPDGRVVAVLGSDSPGGVPTDQVVAVDVATGAERVLPVRLSIASGGLGPAWLDPGSLVVSAAAEDRAPSQLWRLSYPGGQLSRLTNDLSNYTGVSLTADRSSLVTGRSDVRVGVWVGDGSGTSGAEVVPLAPGPKAAVVAWAGERLLHTTTASGHTSIAAFTARAMSDEIVTGGLFPAATSDGRMIVFVSAERGDRAGLWKVDADGRHLVQLVSGDARRPVVTRDDRSVIFGSTRSGRQILWSVSIDGGPPTQLANVFAFAPDVSPDGKFLVFGASTTTWGELGICDLPACTNLRRVITPQGGSIPRWTPDGKGIAFYYIDRGDNLWVQPLDGSALRQLTHFADNRAIVGFAWSRDGTRLAIARATQTNDIVLFKGLRR